MEQDPNKHQFKVLLIGNTSVGKTCMLMRFAENQFTYNFYNTIGVDFKLKTIRIDDKLVNLQIWDTAGQDRFRTITCSYYRGAHGILIVYDITERETFEHVKTWMAEIEKNAKPGVQKLLIGNKSDCGDRRQVSFEEGRELANSFKMPFLETSAQSGANIDLAFYNLSKSILNSGVNSQSTRPVGMKIQQNKHYQGSSSTPSNRTITLQQQQQAKTNQDSDCC